MAKLNLDDLMPKEAEFSIPSYSKEKKFKLRKFSLRVRVWAREKFGVDYDKKLSTDEEMLASIAYYLLMDNDEFKTQDEFFDAICSPADRVALLEAVLATIGIDKKLLEEFAKENATKEGAENPPQAPIQ